MGLLDDVVGQLTGDASRDRAAAGDGNMARIAAALLPVVIGMLAGGARGGSSTGVDRAGTGGGLGGILGQVLGGGGASGAGGLGELLERFQRAGFGEQARSWVGTGANQAIPPDAVERVFGHEGLADIARRAGLSEGDVSRGLSQLMPEVVDRMTPEGRVPDADSLLASVDSFAKRLGG